jgi:uncharacterized membrane protein
MPAEPGTGILRDTTNEQERQHVFLRLNDQYDYKDTDVMWRRFARRRALVKTVSWRGLSFLITTLAIWVISGRLTLAASVGLAEVLVKSLGYYLHECIWEWVALQNTPSRPFFAGVRKRVGWLTEDAPVVQPEELIG